MSRKCCGVPVKGLHLSACPKSFSVDGDIFKYITKTDGCWLWNSWKNTEGYGAIQINNKQLQAHRVVFELLVGKIPAGMVTDHLCRNHTCVNPSHIEIVTIKENVLRGFGPPALNKRKTVCDNGHEYTPENTGIQKTGRFCRICSRATKKRFYLRSK